MEVEDEISKALSVLGAVADCSMPPAIVVLPPDSGSFIVGNRGGFIRLAISALKAARGEEQAFKGEPWIVEDDLDWSVKGLRPDENAHLYLPEKQSRVQRIRSSILGFAIPPLLISCFLVGLITIGVWLVRWIARL